MASSFKRQCSSSGATLVEYAVLVALLSVVVIGVASHVGNGVADTFCKVGGGSQDEAGNLTWRWNKAKGKCVKPTFFG